jgi:hypothetical protein
VQLALIRAAKARRAFSAAPSSSGTRIGRVALASAKPETAATTGLGIGMM